MISIDLDELYILNLVLGKGDIFAIPSLNSKKIPSLLAEKVYNSLIKKEILKNSNTFTEKGAKLVKCIADYKSAPKYMKRRNLAIGLYEEGCGIVLLKNPFVQKYFFLRVKIKSNLDDLQNMEENEDVFFERLCSNKNR